MAGVPNGKMGTPSRQREATCFEGDARIFYSEEDRTYAASDILPVFSAEQLFPLRQPQEKAEGCHFSS